MDQNNEIKVVLSHVDFISPSFNKHNLAKIWCASELLIRFTYLMKRGYVSRPDIGFSSFVKNLKGKFT